MKYITINSTLYNKEKIIGIDPIQQDTEHQIDETGTWYFIVYIQDAIEEIITDEDVSNLMMTRNRILAELEEDTLLESLLKEIIKINTRIEIEQDKTKLLDITDEMIKDAVHNKVITDKERKQIND